MEAATASHARKSAAAGAPAATPPPSLPSRRETLIALVGLAVLGVLTFGSHVVNGGFYLDDWSNAAGTRWPTDGRSVLEQYWDVTHYRPVLVPYIPLVHAVFGDNPELHNAYSLLLRIGMSLAVYVVARASRLGVPGAAAVAGLLLLFPSSDTAVLWSTASMAHLSTGLVVAGIAFAIYGLRRGRGLRFHAVAAALYAVAVLAYEVAAPLVGLAFLLYRLHAPWTPVLRRWAVDLVTLALTLGWVGSQTPRNVKTFDEQLEHLRAIADAGLSIFARNAAPYGSLGRQTVLAAVLACVLAAALVWFLLPRVDDARRSLGRWLAAFGAGVVIMAAGWVMYVPAATYYLPSQPGLGNRVNVVAGIGIVLCLVAAAALAGVLLFRGLPRGRALAGAVAAAYVAFLAIGYYDDDRTSVENYRLSYVGQLRVLDTIERAIGKPEPDSVIYVFGQALYHSNGVPVFAASWDLRAAVKVHWDDRTLSGYPIAGFWSVTCTAEGVQPSGGGWTESHRGDYGDAVLVDVSSGRAERVDSRAECERVAPTFPNAPYTAPVVE
jgi:hypothetical protein